MNSLKSTLLSFETMFMVANMSIIERISKIFASLFWEKKKDSISEFNLLGEYEKLAFQVFINERSCFLNL